MELVSTLGSLVNHPGQASVAVDERAVIGRRDSSKDKAAQGEDDPEESDGQGLEEDQERHAKEWVWMERKQGRDSNLVSPGVKVPSLRCETAHRGSRPCVELLLGSSFASSCGSPSRLSPPSALRSSSEWEQESLASGSNAQATQQPVANDPSDSSRPPAGQPIPHVARGIFRLEVSHGLIRCRSARPVRNEDEINLAAALALAEDLQDALEVTRYFACAWCGGVRGEERDMSRPIGMRERTREWEDSGLNVPGPTPNHSLQ